MPQIAQILIRRNDMKQFALTILVVIFLITGTVEASESLASILASRGSVLVTEARTAGADGKTVFARFVELVSTELSLSGDLPAAEKISGAMKNHSMPEFPRTEFAWIIHTFAREFYKDDIIRETGELIKFKTFAVEGVSNRENPEFIKQKGYLRSLSEKLGLRFNDVGGYIQEIWIGDGSESFGLMSHSDVQPVLAEEWSHDPWRGDILNGKIWGRGSVDDKGPIVAIMYGMRAILDSGLPLRKKIILLVGTDEESKNEDVSTYLKTNKAPDQTIVVDSNFPVICAEKGWCGYWLHLPKDAGKSTGNGLLVTSIQSGFSPSIVPERAVSKIISTKGSGAKLKNEIEKKIVAFQKRRAGSKIKIGFSGDTLVLTALGKTVHSASPKRGHNALMDLLVFLDNDLKVLPNAYGLLTKFAARYIGLELNGKSLGIAHADAFMGSVTIAANMFATTDTSVMFMFNFRVPRGTDSLRTIRELTTRFNKFEKEYGVTFSETHYLSEAHVVDPQSPFVRKLLTIYNSITKENRKAESIGGGTYARRIPNAVVFGPALPDEEYLGHRPNEYLLISTLVRNIEILTHTMVEFGL